MRKELIEEDIADVNADLARAARAAVEQAGFDGVEIHNAYGTLIDQSFHESANQRVVRWGCSIEACSRFTLELTKAVIGAVGKDNVGIRVSPYSTYPGMEMQDPLPQFVYLVSEASQLGIAWLHVLESRIEGIFDVVRAGTIRPLIEIRCHQFPIMVNGGFTPDNASEAVQSIYKEFNVVISFGRWSISDPDLVSRLRSGLRLTPYDRSTFDEAKSKEGYVNYTFAE